ncbi:MAG: amidohydrolase family protein [Acidimicrobiales bacterium]|nr:amidohydrolase family protein [Acidimicrobiales bacterium]
MNAPPEPAASHPAASRTIVNAVVLSMADDQDWFRGWIQIGADGRIAALGPGDPPHSPDALGVVDDVGGAFVAPGFVSAHSHLYTSGMRGMTPGEPLYGWVQVQAALMTGTDIEDAYWMTLHGCLDFIDNGITSAYNFTCTRLLGGYDAATDSRTVVQEQPPEFVHRQIDAGRDAGLRVANAIRLDTELQPVDQAYELFGRTVEYVRQALPADLDLGPSVFGAQQWSDTPETSRHEARAMDTHGLGNQAHFLETSEALEQQRRKFRWYEQSGALRPGFLFGHFVHPDEEMARAAAASGSGMVWQPTSNGRLASGVADIARFRALGMPIGVGLDDQSCTDISDPFQNMRIGIYTQRAVHRDASVVMPREMIRLHTLGSAEALGVADRIGSIEVGKLADLVVVDPTDPDTGPVWDVYAHYAFACGLRNLKTVYIGGRVASLRGRSTNPLAAQVGGELDTRVRRAAAKAGLRLAW